jgi:phosphatidylserine/phosphatidylglycerophosphate/cardiolipin synthase-like enzyme
VSLPSDFSFRSARLAPPIPITPDNVARDHRKLVFYDLDETDPYAGELLASGIGIGEHYASATWEDRGFRLRGPAALEVRAALRRMLNANGFRDDQIPPALRVATGALHGPNAADARQNVDRVLQVHNEPGFGPKRAAVARAMLYSLTPPGSVVVVPDPLWLSETWAGMLAGAAARGSTVAIIAPAKANAPSPEAPVMALERDVLHRLLALRATLSAFPTDAAASDALGDDPPVCCTRALHVGVYAGHAPVTDVAGRLRETREGLAHAPWIREVIPFDASALAVLNQATAQAGHADAVATSIAEDEKPRDPQLHQKTQLIARPGAIAALIRQPGWESVLAQNIRDQAQQSARLADAIGAPIPPADTAAARAADERLQRYERSLSPSDRKRLTFYFALGSFNHDLRGQALDGEASVIVSGFDGSAGLVDLFYLMTRTTWVESNAEIDRLVPAPSWLMGHLARLVRFAM